MPKSETNASRKADVLMKQYIKELVGSYTDRDAVLSEVRPNMDLVDEDLRDQLDRSLAENPATKTRIKQRIANLYDDKTGPQSLRGSSDHGEEPWKEQLYERTLEEIFEEISTQYWDFIKATSITPPRIVECE